MRFEMKKNGERWAKTDKSACANISVLKNRVRNISRFLKGSVRMAEIDEPSTMSDYGNISQAWAPSDCQSAISCVNSSPIGSFVRGIRRIPERVSIIRIGVSG